MEIDIAALRTEYKRRSLRKADVHADPMAQFGLWFDEALRAGVPDPNAMTVATASPDGHPSARVLLLKGYDERGFVFFTNYLGRKGRELEENPRAALCFWWYELERQVRIEGEVARVSAEESTVYFQSRPRGSQIGAWASAQSEVVPSRETLEERFAAVEARFSDGEVERPPHWGGYRLRPEALEFWQGRASRLHDRIRYRREDGGWIVERLAP